MLPDRRTPEIREARPGVFVLELRGTRRRPAEELGVLIRTGATWTVLGPEGVLSDVSSFHDAVAALRE
ncbi:hypothetical protein C5C27_10350 [Rathayibacter sp. AY2B7]|uniref:hypothetical protein n=1 Tax=Rathayibacter sp. AY2B7 TaxID=2080571 RepID=UPI000CE8FCF7|nr:hypothetical protein [Rathayibacter sp. AY2B7]PPG58730.1 hypothetical protein C5C27_10350 [Rathayibacter sp. AY2B7]